MSWPTAKRLSDSEKAGEQPAHGNSAEIQQSRGALTSQTTKCAQGTKFLSDIKRKEEWWLVEGGGTANKTREISTYKQEDLLGSLTEQSALWKLVLPPYGNTKNTRRWSPIPGKCSQTKLKAGCDSIAILDMS